MRTLLTEAMIQTRVQDLGRQISKDFADKPLTVLGVLTGCLIFLSDLIRQMDLPLKVGLLEASSYRGATTTRGELAFNVDRVPDLKGRHVLLVDDIFDTGHTLAQVVQKMHEFEPTSIRSAVLLRKHGRQEVDYLPDFVAFDIPDEFVVGYGLDYEDMYRNLPYLAALEPEDEAGAFLRVLHREGLRGSGEEPLLEGPDTQVRRRTCADAELAMFVRGDEIGGLVFHRQGKALRVRGGGAEHGARDGAALVVQDAPGGRTYPAHGDPDLARREIRDLCLPVLHEPRVGDLDVSALDHALDLEPAFPDLKDDARFAQHASKLRATLDAALASPPLNCSGITAIRRRDHSAAIAGRWSQSRSASACSATRSAASRVSSLRSRRRSMRDRPLSAAGWRCRARNDRPH